MYDEEKKKIQRLNKWEMQILECVKTRSRTEKKIAKIIGLDSSIVFSLITNLMMHGYIEIVTKRRLFFFFTKYCVLTHDGLVALEDAKRHHHPPVDTILDEIRSRVSEIVTDARKESIFFNATWHIANASYKVAKFILSSR